MEELTKCPRFDDCNCTLCPLDDHLEYRVYRKGEPICFYIREFMKGAEPIGAAELYINKKIVGKLTVLLLVGGSNFRDKLDRVRTQPSKRAITRSYREHLNHSKLIDLRSPLTGETEEEHVTV